MNKKDESNNQASEKSVPSPQKTPEQKSGEVGGPKGLEPTRFGDWEKGGRCTDF